MSSETGRPQEQDIMELITGIGSGSTDVFAELSADSKSDISAAAKPRSLSRSRPPAPPAFPTRPVGPPPPPAFSRSKTPPPTYDFRSSPRAPSAPEIEEQIPEGAVEIQTTTSDDTESTPAWTWIGLITELSFKYPEIVVALSGLLIMGVTPEKTAAALGVGMGGVIARQTRVLPRALRWLLEKDTQPALQSQDESVTEAGGVEQAFVESLRPVDTAVGTPSAREENRETPEQRQDRLETAKAFQKEWDLVQAFLQNAALGVKSSSDGRSKNASDFWTHVYSQDKKTRLEFSLRQRNLQWENLNPFFNRLEPATKLEMKFSPTEVTASSSFRTLHSDILRLPEVVNKKVKELIRRRGNLRTTTRASIDDLEAVNRTYIDVYNKRIEKFYKSFFSQEFHRNPKVRDLIEKSRITAQWHGGEIRVIVPPTLEQFKNFEVIFREEQFVRAMVNDVFRWFGKLATEEDNNDVKSEIQDFKAFEFFGITREMVEKAQEDGKDISFVKNELVLQLLKQGWTEDQSRLYISIKNEFQKQRESLEYNEEVPHTQRLQKRDLDARKKSVESAWEEYEELLEWYGKEVSTERNKALEKHLKKLSQDLYKYLKNDAILKQLGIRDQLTRNSILSKRLTIVGRDASVTVLQDLARQILNSVPEDIKKRFEDSEEEVQIESTSSFQSLVRQELRGKRYSLKRILRELKEIKDTTLPRAYTFNSEPDLEILDGLASDSYELIVELRESLQPGPKRTLSADAEELDEAWWQLVVAQESLPTDDQDVEEAEDTDDDEDEEDEDEVNEDDEAPESAWDLLEISGDNWEDLLYLEESTLDEMTPEFIDNLEAAITSKDMFEFNTRISNLDRDRRRVLLKSLVEDWIDSLLERQTEADPDEPSEEMLAIARLINPDYVKNIQSGEWDFTEDYESLVNAALLQLLRKTPPPPKKK